MRQFTDPVHAFKLPFDAAQLRQIRAAYQQDGTTVLTKAVDGPFPPGERVEIPLTQAETGGFKPGNALVQLRVITLGGSSAVSKPVSFYVGQTFDGEAIL